MQAIPDIGEFGPANFVLSGTEERNIGTIKLFDQRDGREGRERNERVGEENLPFLYGLLQQGFKMLGFCNVAASEQDMTGWQRVPLERSPFSTHTERARIIGSEAILLLF